MSLWEQDILNTPYREWIAFQKKRYLRTMLKHSKNQSVAAQRAGMESSTLINMRKRLGINIKGNDE